MTAHDPGLANATVPRFDLKPGTIVEIGPRGGKRRLFKVERRLARRGSEPSRLEFLDVATGQPSFKDDRALAFHMQQGEFRVAFGPDGTALPDTPEAGEPTGDQEAAALRRRAYVDACLALGNPPPRSRKALAPVIDRVAAERGDTVPGFTSVLGWVDRWLALGDARGTASLATRPNRGNRTPRKVKGAVGAAIRRAIDESRGKRTAADVRKLAGAHLARERPDLDGEALPDLRTFQRLISGLDAFAADALRFGPGAAERKRRGRYERRRPTLPLEEVECDHTPLDVLLCDEQREVIFGRADAITFRDRCTGVCLGLSIGFEAPSYASFLAGLRHAIYPKDMSGYPGIENPWFAFGRFKRLYVDNALHFIGHDIRHAGSELKFDLVEFRPGSPWLKGGEEKLQGDLNRAVSHKLPASTFSNPAERKLYEEYAELPVLTVAELRAYLTWWICDEYHVSGHEGLGFLSTLKDVPKRLWDEKLEDLSLPELPRAEIFVALAGSVDHRCINTKGIRWDHIRYQSNELDVLRNHPDHRNGREDDGRPGRKHHGTEYKVVRDPCDLGAIWVHNPYDPDRPRIRIPAPRSDYADGLTLHQHRVFVANARKKLLATLKDPVDELARSKQDVTALAQAMMARRKKTGVQKLLARFLERGERHHHRSVVSLNPVSAELSASPLDPRAPVDLPRPAPISPNAPSPTPARPPREGTEVEPMSTGDGLPKRQDRGAGRAARKGTAEPVPAIPDAASVRDRKRRAGWANVATHGPDERPHDPTAAEQATRTGTERAAPEDDGRPGRDDEPEGRGPDRPGDDASDGAASIRERKKRDASWNA